MARVLVEFLLPLAAPFLLYLLWRWLVTRGGRVVARIPWFALTLAGLALAALTFVGLVLTSGSGPASVYVPAHMEDGTLVPGHFDPRPAP
ncbi:MAG: DUF6111 family protein [Geminicoccaceae bacterium]